MAARNGEDELKAFREGIKAVETENQAEEMAT
jgi:hypothetical protein